MKKIAVIVLALGLLGGCSALSGIFDGSGTGGAQETPPRMVQLELAQLPSKPSAEPRTILFTTSAGQFSQQIVDEAESTEVGMPRTVIQISGRVFEIEPDFVKLNVVMRIQDPAGKMLNFDRTVTPIPGQKLLLHDDGTQTITLLAWVIPGANDPQKAEILANSPPEAYVYRPRQPVMPVQPKGSTKPITPTSPGDTTSPVVPPEPQPGEVTGEVTPPAGEPTPPATGEEPKPAEPAPAEGANGATPIVPMTPLEPSSPTTPATP